MPKILPVSMWENHSQTAKAGIQFRALGSIQKEHGDMLHSSFHNPFPHRHPGWHRVSAGWWTYTTPERVHEFYFSWDDILFLICALACIICSLISIFISSPMATFIFGCLAIAMFLCI